MRGRARRRGGSTPEDRPDFRRHATRPHWRIDWSAPSSSAMKLQRYLGGRGGRKKQVHVRHHQWARHCLLQAAREGGPPPSGSLCGYLEWLGWGKGIRAGFSPPSTLDILTTGLRLRCRRPFSAVGAFVEPVSAFEIIASRGGAAIRLGTYSHHLPGREREAAAAIDAALAAAGSARGSA